MVSRRNFFAITAMILTIVFLFNFSNAGREALSDYNINKFAGEVSELTRSDVFDPAGSARDLGDESESREEVAFIGRGLDDGVGGQVQLWARYTKRALLRYASLTQYENSHRRTPELIILDESAMSWESDAPRLQAILEEGIPVVCCGLPEPALFEARANLRELFGIQRIQAESTALAGVYLMNGFLLGGGRQYLAQAGDPEETARQDLNLSCPWYTLGPACKSYLKGIPADGAIEPENYPPLIWRSQKECAGFYAVSGDYLGNGICLGILSGISAQIHDYTLYPVVNARSMVLAGFPSLANENGPALQLLYSRATVQLENEILWPDLMSMRVDTDLRMTCMLSPQFEHQDGNEPSGEILAAFMKQFRENGIEAGLATGDRSELPLSERLTLDWEFLRQELPDYAFTSYYQADLEDPEFLDALSGEELAGVRTVVCPQTPESEAAAPAGSPVSSPAPAPALEPIGFLTQNVTFQRATVNGLDYAYSDDLRVRCLETALLYGCEVTGLDPIFYPENNADGWNILGKVLASNSSACWEAYQGYDTTSLTENDARIRNFLALDYTEERRNNEITLETNGVEGPVWFVLRTHDEELLSVRDGAMKKLEDDAWLVRVDHARAILVLEPVFTSAERRLGGSFSVLLRPSS